MRIIINYALKKYLLQQILIIIVLLKFFFTQYQQYNFDRIDRNLFQMSKNRVCFNCGSSSFVSDRSLGGKIVCSKCGSSSFKNKSSSFFKSKKFLFLAIAIAIFIIVIQSFCLYSKVHHFQSILHLYHINYLDSHYLILFFGGRQRLSFHLLAL